jgi:hypothetical protein
MSYQYRSVRITGTEVIGDIGTVDTRYHVAHTRCMTKSTGYQRMRKKVARTKSPYQYQYRYQYLINNFFKIEKCFYLHNPTSLEGLRF